MKLFDLEMLTELSDQEAVGAVGGQGIQSAAAATFEPKAAAAAAAGSGGGGIYTTDACEILTTVNGAPTIKWDWSNQYCVYKALNGSPNAPV